jgi:hypothetical protein
MDACCSGWKLVAGCCDCGNELWQEMSLASSEPRRFVSTAYGAPRTGGRGFAPDHLHATTARHYVVADIA